MDVPQEWHGRQHVNMRGLRTSLDPRKCFTQATLPKLNPMYAKRNLLFQGAIFRFHVKLWDGNQHLLLEGSVSLGTLIDSTMMLRQMRVYYLCIPEQIQKHHI